MTAVLMDGKALAAEVRERVKKCVEGLKADGIHPNLATILVGDDASSKLYLNTKHKAAAEVGIASMNHTLPADAKESDLMSLISSLNAAREVNGILLQLPLPRHLNAPSVVDLISPSKDVDGLTTTNAGKLVYGSASLVPCTPRGVMELLHRYDVRIKGAHAVVINRTTLVGKPLSLLLLAEDATVTICHSKTRDLPEITRRADILVAAIGRRAEFAVTAEMVNDGATVIDVGTSRVDGKLMGDVDFPGVAEKAAFITPVPGGVGPMTVAMLLENTVRATVGQTKEGGPGN